MANCLVKVTKTYTLTLDEEERKYLMDRLQNAPDDSEDVTNATHRGNIYNVLHWAGKKDGVIA